MDSQLLSTLCILFHNDIDRIADGDAFIQSHLSYPNFCVIHPLPCTNNQFAWRNSRCIPFSSFEVFGNLTLFQHQRCTRWSICNRITNPVYRSFFSFRL